MSFTVKGAGKLAAIGMAAAMLAGCGGGDDARVFDLSISDAQNAISGKKSQYTSGKQTRYMAAAGATQDGVRVRLSGGGSFAHACRLRFEPLGDTQTRITPDCGATGSAVEETLMAYFEMEIDAHVRKILTGQTIDAKALAKKQMMVTAKNARSIIKEGGPSEEFVQRAQQSAERRVQNEQDGWGNDAAGADGWGS